MRKVFTSLIVLLVVLAIVPVAAWANSVALGPPNSNWLQNIAINSTGTGTQSWNEFQMQFNGATFLGGLSWNGGPWTYSAGNNVLSGVGPANWNSTLYLTLALFPSTKGPLFIDVFQYSNGTLLSGASTQLTWNGSTWSTSSLAPTGVPEPHVVVLMGITALVGGALRKRLV
jgi:hypothetical protein